jgi:hypothetical protein
VPIGPRIGLNIGAAIGPRSAGGQTWSVDATSGKALPVDAAEAAALLTAAGVTADTLALYHFGVPASGDVTDSSGNSKTLTAGGTTRAYQQAVTGWTAKSLKTTAGSAGKLTNNTFGNVNATSYTVILYALLAAGTAQRSIMRIGGSFDDDACLEMTSGELLSVGEGNGTRSNGASTIHGQVRPLVLRIDDTGNTVDGFTDAEKVVGGPQTCNGTELCFGGDNTQTHFPATCDYIFAWVIGAALTDQQLYDLLTEAGWAPAF